MNKQIVVNIFDIQTMEYYSAITRSIVYATKMKHENILLSEKNLDAKRHILFFYIIYPE